MDIGLPGNGRAYLEVWGSPLVRRGFPRIGAVVQGVVEQIGVATVSVKICSVDGARSAEYLGVIKKEDACFAFRDDMHISDMFMPGDSVKAKIVSLGGAGALSLSTVDEGLGRCSTHGAEAMQ